MYVNDFVFNGQTSGELGGILNQDNGMGVRFDTGLLRPYFEPRKSDGRMVPVCSMNTGRTVDIKGSDGKALVINGENVTAPVMEVVEVKDLIDAGIQSPVFNATSLTKDQWIKFDTRVQRALRNRLRAWADLSAANPMGGFDGMSSEMLEYETITDDGEAIVDMDGVSEGRSDESTYQLQGLPLPITHSSFYISKRKLAISRKNGTPLSTIRAEHAARRIAEKIEQTLIGTITGIQFGDVANYGIQPTVYGYLNHPHRLTKSDFTASATATGENLLDEFLAARGQLNTANFNGPWMVYVSTAYDDILDDDFKANSDKTTRQRLLEIDGIQNIKRLDNLTGDVIIFVQMDPEVAEAVNGLDPQTVQWESNAGMRLNMKVLTIQVPFIKTFSSNTTGILHGTTS